MLPILVPAIPLHQNLPLPGYDDQIVEAFTKVFRTPLTQKTLRGQLTIVAKNGEDAQLYVYNYQTTFGKTPQHFRSESQLKVGVEAAQHPFLAVADGKSLFVYNKAKNLYRLDPSKQLVDSPPIFAGLSAAFFLIAQRVISEKLAISQIKDAQAAQEALAILPKLFAQQGLTSGGTRKEPDGRYTLFQTIKSEEIPIPAVFTITLRKDQQSIERIRIELHSDDKTSVAITEVVESIAPASALQKFAIEIPRRAKKVKELPGLLDSL